MRNIFIVFIVLLIGLPIFVGAQVDTTFSTAQWRLFWDSNTESDMSHYGIVKQTGSGEFVWVDSVNHRWGQDKHQWIDEDIVPGVLYSYYLHAYDLSSLIAVTDTSVSLPSDTVSAAVPDMFDIPDQLINLNSGFVNINLSDYVNDPDGDSLIWSVIGAENIEINILDDIAYIDSDSMFIGIDTVLFIVEEADTTTQFKDSDQVIFGRAEGQQIERVRNVKVGKIN